MTAALLAATTRLVRVAVAAMVVAVLAAAALSFRATAEVAKVSGAAPASLSWMFPLVIEGGLAIATVLAVLRLMVGLGLRACAPEIGTGALLLGLSVATQLAAYTHSIRLLGGVLAVSPPVVLALGAELLLRARSVTAKVRADMDASARAESERLADVERVAAERLAAAADERELHRLEAEAHAERERLEGQAALVSARAAARASRTVSAQGRTSERPVSARERAAYGPVERSNELAVSANERPAESTRERSPEPTVRLLTVAPLDRTPCSTSWPASTAARRSPAALLRGVWACPRSPVAES